jgi:hypothetical protein
MIAIAAQVKTAKKVHKVEIDELKKKLDNAAKDFRDKLQTRGSTRSGGTDKAWNDARKAYDDWWGGGAPPTTKWYEPFSMAAKPRKRYFPFLKRKMLARAKSYLERVG